ncbi:MAG: PaeR7I family type II restriction endonuclease, partial [Vicinamibacterales bacterium]
MSANPEIAPYVFSDAVRAFWSTRLQQLEAQRLRDVTDQGTRGAVTAGQQMNGFARIIVELIESVGVDPGDIYLKGSALPGYFRPTKNWDIVVATNDTLLAAIELKSMVGSFGNNLNNRTEEALGNAVDLWTAYREGAFRASPQPWLGYLFVLEAIDKSLRPVRVRSPRFPEFD